MRLKTGKAVSKYLRAFIFLLLLLKGAFPLKAAYAQTTTGCLANPVCAQMLKSELAPTIAAPTGTGFGASTLSVTTSTGASTTVEVVDRVAVIAGALTKAYVIWRYWDQAHNEWAQAKARERYCSVYSGDQVCVPFTGGQCQTRYYVRAQYDVHYKNGGGLAYTHTTGEDELLGPVLGVRVDNSPSNFGLSVLAYGIQLYYNSRFYSEPTWIGLTGDSTYWLEARNPRMIEIRRKDGQPDNCGAPPPLPWKDWPQAKRDAAVDLLNDSDWQELRESMPSGGILGPDDTIDAPESLIEGDETDDPDTPEDERQPKNISGPLKWLTNADKPYTFPSPLNEELTMRQKLQLLERRRAGRLTIDDINSGITRPIPDDPDNRRCFYTELPGHLGNPEYPNPGEYATRVTGSARDIFIMAPNGIPFITYDGEVKSTGASAYSVGETQGAVAEVKTQHLWLIKVARGYPLNADEETKWTNLKIQLNRQADVARECKLRYFIAFDNQNVATVAGPMLVNMLSPKYPQIRVHFLP